MDADRVRELEQQIAELEAQIPATSTMPLGGALVEELDALYEELEKARKEVGEKS